MAQELSALIGLTIEYNHYILISNFELAKSELKKKKRNCPLPRIQD